MFGILFCGVMQQNWNFYGSISSMSGGARMRHMLKNTLPTVMHGCWK